MAEGAASGDDAVLVERDDVLVDWEYFIKKDEIRKQLIDANACPALFNEQYKETVQLINQGETHLDNLAEGFTEAYRVIQGMPTADAVPVVHGWWELFGNDDDCGCSYFCSNCHKSYDEDLFYIYGQFVTWNYCPNCRSRMDGGTK